MVQWCVSIQIYQQQKKRKPGKHFVFFKLTWYLGERQEEAARAAKSHFRLLIVPDSLFSPLLSCFCRTSGKSQDFLKLITSSLFLRIGADFLLLQITSLPLLQICQSQDFFASFHQKVSTYIQMGGEGGQKTRDQQQEQQA